MAIVCFQIDVDNMDMDMNMDRSFECRVEFFLSNTLHLYNQNRVNNVRRAIMMIIIIIIESFNVVAF